MGDDEGGRNLGSCGRGIQRPYWPEQAYGPYMEALIITIRFLNVPSYNINLLQYTPELCFKKLRLLYCRFRPSSVLDFGFSLKHVSGDWF